MSKVEVNFRKRKRDRFWAKVLINSVAILITAELVRGIVLNGIMEALFAAFIFGMVNSVIRPFFVILSLPFTVITLGLFTFVINGLMLLLTAGLMPGFAISGFWSAVWGSILISIFSSLISTIFDQD